MYIVRLYSLLIDHNIIVVLFSIIRTYVTEMFIKYTAINNCIQLLII